MHPKPQALKPVCRQIPNCSDKLLTSLSGADPFGSPTLRRPWNEGDGDMEIAKKRLSAAFEFFTKLGVKK